MKKLLDWDQEGFGHGEILRVRGQVPYEHYVDFMIFDNQDKIYPFGLLTMTGKMAGLIFAIFPQECSMGDGMHGLDYQWLLDNWEIFIYPDCPVSDVYVTYYKSLYPIQSVPKSVE